MAIGVLMEYVRNLLYWGATALLAELVQIGCTLAEQGIIMQEFAVARRHIWCQWVTQ